MNVTKRTHYNPCFWTALWNHEYYKAVENQEHDSLPAREQKVYCLNLYQNEVRQISTNQVFFENNLGLVKFDEKDIEQFIKRNYPEHAKERKFLIKKGDLLIDFEDLFSFLEESPAYKNLISLVKDKKINSLEEKGNIAAFVLVHNIRNHVMINSLIEFGEHLGSSKLEHFILMKWMLQDFEWMKNIISKYISGHWTLYTFKKSIPLTDSPIINDNGEILCVLNPYQILSIRLKKRTNQIQYKTVGNFCQRKRFQKKLISNTYREIVFTNESQAEKWKNSKEWNRRRNLILKKKSFSKMIEKKGGDELWQINAYANKLKKDD